VPAANFNKSFFYRASNYTNDLFSKYFGKNPGSFEEFDAAVSSAIKDMKAPS
jgi:hypothetical protein